MIQNPNEKAAYERVEATMRRIESNVRKRFQLDRRQFICGSFATLVTSISMSLRPKGSRRCTLRQAVSPSSSPKTSIARSARERAAAASFAKRS